MSAIVHEYERSHEQPGRRHGEQQRPPERDREQAIHNCEARDQRQKCRRELQDHASGVGSLVVSNDLTPASVVGTCGSVPVCVIPRRR